MITTVDAQFNTALAGAPFFWNDPLLYTPETSCYYSTHGYTLLGAALEGATGMPIGDIIESEIADPYNLPSLQIVNYDVPDANRATLYNDKNIEIIPSNPSFKVLGGGLQASAYDLVRWGRRVVNGSILSPESLETMWTVPEPTPCIGGDDDNDLSNYALGWYARTEQGTPVVAHGGSWSGYSSYIRMYPEEEIVIVVLSNRRGGGFSPGQLGQAIGTLVLTESQTSRWSSFRAK